MGAKRTPQHPELADTPALVNHLLHQVDQLLTTQKNRSAPGYWHSHRWCLASKGFG